MMRCLSGKKFPANDDDGEEDEEQVDDEEEVNDKEELAPETFYLEDDFTQVARFPSEVTGGFNSTFWHDRVTMQVMGECLPHVGDDSVTLPSPQQLGVSRPGQEPQQTKP
ncbi:hypothetical protein ACROYT_G015371 [Oculina patagonica]